MVDREARLSVRDLETLLEADEGLRVSLYMPAVPSDPAGQQIILKNLVGEAEQRLVDAGLRSPDARDLLRPARELLQKLSFWRNHKEGLAMFLAPEFFGVHRLPLECDELIVVSGRFHIKPLLPFFSGNRRFYVLALSQNDVRLFEGTHYGINELELKAIPTSLSEALQRDTPEKHLQFHTRTPTQRAALFHGHGGGADESRHKQDILKFFQQVADGLSNLLATENAPLVLAGVGYILAIYREANTYGNLLADEITGNPENLTPEELHKEAWAIAGPVFQRDQEKAVARYHEMKAEGLATTALEGIVSSAYFKRVETLFVAIGYQRWGRFDPDANVVSVHEEEESGDQDLLDFAAVHALLNGGAVYAVEPAEVPDAASIAAVLRY